MHQPPINDRTKWERVDIDLRSESLVLSRSKYQNNVRFIIDVIYNEF